MGKVSVVTVVRTKLRYYFKQEAQPQLEQQVESMARSCVKAAKKMLHLFEDLRRTGNLTRFSFTDFQGCSIATIVVLLAGILERDSNYDRQVALGLDCLRIMGEGSTAGKMGVSFVEALQAIATEAAEKLRRTHPRPESSASSLSAIAPSDQQLQQQQQQQQQPAAAYGTDYNSWVTWLANQNQSQNQAAQLQGDAAAAAAAAQQQPVSPSTVGGLMPAQQPWAGPRPAPAGFSTWDGAAALQQLSVPSFGPSALGQEPGAAAAAAAFVPQNADFMPALYGDDQTFLMGLTGFEVLGFSDLNEL